MTAENTALVQIQREAEKNVDPRIGLAFFLAIILSVGIRSLLLAS